MKQSITTDIMAIRQHAARGSVAKSWDFYIDMAITRAKRDVFDGVDALLDKWSAYVSLRVFDAIQELRKEHIPSHKHGSEKQ